MRSATEQRGRARRAPRLTIRRRLALTYAAVIAVTGIIILALMYFLIGVVSTVLFASAPDHLAGSAPTGTAQVQTQGPDHGSAVKVDGDLVPVGNNGGIVIRSRADLQRLILLGGGTAVVVIAFGGAGYGWWLSGRTLRPLAALSHAAGRAAAGDLDHRIQLVGPSDELTDLADSFDDMMEKLQASFAVQRRFAANASHELRTPLATTKAILEVAVAGRQEVTATVLARLREANERSIATVERLLDLAEIESGGIHFGEVDLASVGRDVAVEVAREADESGVSISCHLNGSTVHGDPGLIHQLLLNLAQNAVRHNITGGFIRITTSRAGQSSVLQVENSGPIVEAHSVPTLTEPFARAASRIDSGNRGLGLPIVKAITQRHQAALDLAARPAGGLTVRVTFPPTVIT